LFQTGIRDGSGVHFRLQQQQVIHTKCKKEHKNLNTAMYNDVTFLVASILGLILLSDRERVIRMKFSINLHFSFVFICVANANLTTVMEVFQNWISNFNEIETLVKFSREINEEDNFEGTLKSGKKLFKISDFEDFSFSGSLDDHGLPEGYGVLINDDVEVGARDYCFRGKCQQSVVQVVGNFSLGLLNGVGEVYFSDGSFVRGEFRECVLHGLVVEFDTNRRHRYTGRY